MSRPIFTHYVYIDSIPMEDSTVAHNPAVGSIKKDSPWNKDPSDKGGSSTQRVEVPMFSAPPPFVPNKGKNTAHAYS